jgi:hypothetical protein
MWKK